MGGLPNNRSELTGGEAMGKGGYNGGSTIIRPGSDWLTGNDAKSKPKRVPYSQRYQGLSEAELGLRIERASERLAKTQADFDAGRLRARPPEPAPLKVGKKKRKKLKLAAKRAKKRAAK